MSGRWKERLRKLGEANEQARPQEGWVLVARKP